MDAVKARNGKDHELERQLLRLLEASSLLLASPQSEDILKTLLSLGQRFIQADAYAVWWRQAGGTWDIVIMSGLSSAYSPTVSDPKADSQLPREPIAIEEISSRGFLASRYAQYKTEGIVSLLVIPLRIHDQPAGTIVFYYRSPHKFPDSEKRIGAALGNLAASALASSELYAEQKRLREDAERSNRRANFLADAGQVISSSLDYEETLKSIAERAVPFFADWCSVHILDGADIRRVAVRHLDPEQLKIASLLAERFPARDDDAIRVAIRTGSSLLMETIPEQLITGRARSEEHAALMLRLGIRSLIIAPMLAQGRGFGAVTFATAESGRSYSRADLELAEEIARRAAIAIENARLFEETRRTHQQLQLANEELRRANSDLEQFADSASHDLKEPLRNISIYSEMIRRKYAGELDESAQEYLGYVVQNAKRMECLVTDLLAFTRAGSEDGEGESDITKASDALEGAKANLRTTIEELKAAITHDALPEVRIRRIHLEQLFQNLISNALKYRSNQPPRVHIAAQLVEGATVFSVADNGIGIDRAYWELIFGVFKRLHGSDEFPGTGIGLAICKRIVERYRGRIWVESKAGEGATFFFTVPA